MKHRKRLHRNDPPREGPLRKFSNIYRQPGTQNGGSDAHNSHASHRSRRKTDPRGHSGGGVNLAYQVIEKYLNEGRRAAEMLNPFSFGKAAGMGPLEELLERMLRYQTETLPLWLELLGSLVRIDPLRRSTTASNLRPANNGAAVTNNVAVEISCAQPVEVALDLQQDARRSPLAIAGLHALGSKAPALTDIRFNSGRQNRSGTVAIRIPPRQPAGTYSGVIFDPRNGDTRGTLTVRIEKGRSSARARPNE